MNVQEFGWTFEAKEEAEYSKWFAEDMRLNTPIHEKAVVGRDVSCQILRLRSRRCVFELP
jgi:hypothetical protein